MNYICALNRLTRSVTHFDNIRIHVDIYLRSFKYLVFFLSSKPFTIFEFFRNFAFDHVVSLARALLSVPPSYSPGRNTFIDGTVSFYSVTIMNTTVSVPAFRYRTRTSVSGGAGDHDPRQAQRPQRVAQRRVCGGRDRM